MDVLIQPHELSGTISAIASKSVAHRMLILSALCDGITDLTLRQTSQDIDATARCLAALGCSIAATRMGFRMVPLTKRGLKKQPRLDVGESGSTLRFLLPVVCALGFDAHISCHGRLAQRPLAPLDEQLRAHGATLEWIDASTLHVSGTLTAGQFILPGNVSSQFVSGLLMAAPLMSQSTLIAVSEPIESQGYIALTIDALASFGVTVSEGHQIIDGTPCHTYHISSDATLVSPGSITVEGDWSNAAFWLAAGALSTDTVTVSNLNMQSRQGDRSVLAALSMFGALVTRRGTSASSVRQALHAHTLDVSGIPDLVPPLAAVAAVAPGTTRLTNAGRLRLKESDRLQTVRDALSALGGKARIEEDDLVIEGVPALTGGTVDAANDHRIAMMAAICGAFASGPTTVEDAACVTKSYPAFFDDFRSLGGLASQQEG